MLRRRWFMGGGVLLFPLVVVPACGSSKVETAPDGVGGMGGAPPLKGVGEPCNDTDPCRKGLACVDNFCEPGMTIRANEPCTISGECVPGHQCTAGTCQPTGEAAQGEGCRGDIDCQQGLRCAIVGFSTQCVPEGTTDLEGDCTTSADCFAGLACNQLSGGGKCQVPLPGTPSFGVPTFNGVPAATADAADCGRGSSDPVHAYFEVPGATNPAGDEGDFFRLPFPNDIYLQGGHPNLEGFPTPGVNGLVGIDPVKLYVDAIQEHDTGWGTYPTVLFRFSGPIAFESFRQEGSASNPVNWVDITPGDPAFGSSIGLRWLASSGGGNYVCSNWIGVRRPAGRPLAPGHTYAVWMTTAGRADNGDAIERSAHLSSLLAASPPADAVLADAHAAFKPFRDYLQAESIDPASILTASVITTAPVRDTMRDLAAAVEAAPVPTATGWVKCGGGATSPCPQAEGDRACGDGGANYDEYHALVELPIFQRGSAPYLEDGGDVDTSGPVRTEQVCMSLTVPTGTMPASGWPVVVYAHGTGGSFRSHVRDEVAGALAGTATPSGTIQFAVLGIDQSQHGPRRGDSTDDPSNLFFNFRNPLAARGNVQQGAADQIALARFAASLNVTAAETGGDAIQLDPDAIVFFGHSQGSTHGSLGVPYSDVYKAAVLSGNGASLMDSLLNKTEPVNIAAGVPLVLADFDSSFDLPGGDMHPVLSLVQGWIDPADPLNFAALIGRSPAMGETPKHLFQTYGLGDSYSPPITMETYATAAGVTEVTPHSSADPADSLDVSGPDPTPLAGNETVDMETITLGIRQYGPPSGSDGHFVVFDVPAANTDVTRFLGMAAMGEVPQIGQ